MAPIASTSAPTLSSSAAGRLRGIDGLRGLASLWVLVFHIYNGSGVRWLQVPGVDRILNDSFHGVSLFLLLSGFCLYLPFAGGRHKKFAIREFFRRRARRLLPAYYVVLVAVLASKLVVSSALGESYRSTGELAWSILVHVTLLHNLFASTIYELHGAFWSLGLEWQLYLLFPLLIWLIDRFGFFRMLGVALLAHAAYFVAVQVAEAGGLVPLGTLWDSQVLPNQAIGRWAEFVLGMSAAELYVNGKFPRSRILIVAALVVTVALNFTFEVFWPLRELLSGMMCFLVASMILRGGFAGRLFSSRPLVALGTISYSVYLLHPPILVGIDRLSKHLPWDPTTSAFLLSLAAVPPILLGSWAFYRVVERPFMSKTGNPGWWQALVDASQWTIGLVRQPARIQLVEDAGTSVVSKAS